MQNQNDHFDEVVEAESAHHELAHNEEDFDEKYLKQRLVNDAREATEDEHAMSLWQSLKLYRKAAAWSVLLSFSVVMDGFDSALLSSFIGFPAFQKKIWRISSR